MNYSPTNGVWGKQGIGPLSPAEVQNNQNTRFWPAVLWKKNLSRVRLSASEPQVPRAKIRGVPSPEIQS